MKISQLIELLNSYKEQYGDLPVYCADETTNEITTIRHWKAVTDKPFKSWNSPELVELTYGGLYPNWNDRQDIIELDVEVP